MEHFETHSAFYNQVIYLTKGQQEDPVEVLRLFCSVYDLATVRQTICSLLQTALTTKNEPFRKPKAREQVYWFCQDLEEVLEAITLLLQQRPTSSIAP